MSRFPYFTLQELKNGYPSKAKGRSWKAELRYRNECSDIIQAIGPPLHITPYTVHKGVVLLHRCLTRLSSTEFEKLDKWALATACVFLATKIDSTYHSLVNITHVAYRALRDMQHRPYEAEYFNPDGSPGNPSFLHSLAEKVRDAEMALIFAINFDFGVEVPTSSVIWQMRELGLDEAAARADPQVFKIRTLACSLCSKSLLTANSVLCLMFPARQLALAAISTACKQYGHTLELCGRGDQWVPNMTVEELAVVENELVKKLGGGSSSSRPGTPAPSGLSGGAAAAAAAAGGGGASGSVLGTPAGPPAAAAPPGTPAEPSAAAEQAAAAAMHDGAGSSRRHSLQNDVGAGSTAIAVAVAGRHTGDQGFRNSAAAAAVVVDSGVGDSAVGPAAAAATTTMRNYREAAVTADDDDAGLAEEWFQLAAGAPSVVVEDQKVGFQKGGSGPAAAAAAGGASQTGSASEATTVGPRMNNPSPNSIDSLLMAGPQGQTTAAAPAHHHQQQQQQRKRWREGGAEEVGHKQQRCQWREGQVVAMLPELL